MNKIVLIYFLSVFLDAFTQIHINTNIKTIESLNEKEILYESSEKPNPQFFYPLFKANRINNILKSGSNLVAFNPDKSKVYCLSLSGSLEIYNTASGQLIRRIQYPYTNQNIGISNLGSVFHNIVVLDDNTIILECFNFNNTNNLYNNLFVLNISSNKQQVEQLFGNPKYSGLKYDFLFQRSKNKENQSLRSLNEFLSNSSDEISISKRDDGYYFVSKEFIPIKFVQLSDPEQKKSALKSFEEFSNSNVNQNNTQDFLSLVNGEYLLSEVFVSNGQFYALFGTSFGSKYSAKLINLSELKQNLNNLLLNSKRDVVLNYSKVISGYNSSVSLNKELALVEKDGSFFFVSPRFKQNQKCEECTNVWSNSYSWNYHLKLKGMSEFMYPTILMKKQDGFFFGLDEKAKIVNLNFFQINTKVFELLNKIKIENELTVLYQSEFFGFQNEIKKVDLKPSLPILKNQETVLSKTPSKITKIEQCDACAASGYVPDRIYEGNIVSYQRNPITGEKVRCMHCGGTGKVQYETGEIINSQVIVYSDWQIKDVRINVELNEVVYQFEANKSTFLKETRGGHIVKNELKELLTLTEYLNVDRDGIVKQLQNIPKEYVSYKSIFYIN